jgi:hypothetical protein
MSVRRLTAIVALAALVFAAGWFLHRPPPKREAPPEGLADVRGFAITVPDPDGARTHRLTVHRVTGPAGDVLYERLSLHPGAPPPWKIEAGGLVFVAGPASD